MLPVIMVVIYVQKSWIEEIGEMAKHLHFRDDESPTCVSLLGGENTRLNYPFVQTELVTNFREDTGVSKAFIPTHIPASVVLGMFDLTESDARAYGFHPPTKK